MGSYPRLRTTMRCWPGERENSEGFSCGTSKLSPSTSNWLSPRSDGGQSSTKTAGRDIQNMSPTTGTEKTQPATTPTTKLRRSYRSLPLVGGATVLSVDSDGAPGSTGNATSPAAFAKGTITAAGEMATGVAAAGRVRVATDCSLSSAMRLKKLPSALSPWLASLALPTST